ncbi:MAG: MATE family efflux transporter [Legionella sp.]|nr:MATE family efflux transporter [Legionella sp.]
MYDRTINTTQLSVQDSELIDNPENSHEEILLDSDQVALDGEPDLYNFWDVFKKISALSIPMALSFTFSMEIFLVSLLLNSTSEDDDELAATTLITIMLNTLVVIGASPLFAMSVLTSNKIGDLEEAEVNHINEDILAKKREYIAGINRNGLYLSTVLTPVVFSGMFFSKPILTDIFKQKEIVAQIAQDFLRVYAPAVPGLMVRFSSEQMLFSFGRSGYAMISGLLSLGVGTGLAISLERGLLGLPSMGAAGIAIGFAAEAYLTAFAYSIYLARHRDFENYKFFHIFKRFENQFSQLKDLIKMGSSISLSVASEMAMNLSVGVISGLTGIKQQSAISYVNQFSFLNFLALAGFGQSCSQEVNRQIGAKRYENASRIGKYGLSTTMIYTSPIPIFFSVAPQFLILSASKPQEIVDMLKYLAPIMGAGVVIDSARYNLLQQLRVLGDLKGSTIISISGLSLGIAMSAILGLKTHLDIYGVAIGNTGGILLASGGLFYRWCQRIKSEHIRDINEVSVSENPSNKKSFANNLCGFFSKCSKPQEGERQYLLSSPEINNSML